MIPEALDGGALDGVLDLVSLAPTAPSCRQTIAMDATAVLAFDDGVHIPCDRFIMRCFSPVLRRLLEDTTCASDPLGRTVLPVPGQASDPYWNAVDVLHGCSALWSCDLPQLLRLAECMDYLGVTIYEGAVDARLWALLKDSSFDVLLPHAPRFLRNPVLAPAAMCRLIRLRPMWSQFREDVLDRGLGPLDHVLVKAIVHYAPNFFPPFMVATWALGACRALDEETAMHLCRHHGVLYHPAETPLVLGSLSEFLDGNNLENTNNNQPALAARNKAFSKVLRMAVASSEKYDVVPWTANRAHGSVLMYTDTPMASVLITFPGGRMPPHIRVAPWLKVSVRHDGRLDVEFKPRKIDAAAETYTSVQMRVLCHSTALSPAWRTCEEAWYAFALNPGGGRDEVYTLAQATRAMGSPATVAALLRSTHMPRHLRLDFFYGPESVFLYPFDATKCPAFISV